MNYVGWAKARCAVPSTHAAAETRRAHADGVATHNAWARRQGNASRVDGGARGAFAHPTFRIAILAASLFVLAAEPASAQDVPRLTTNQAYVEELARAIALDVADPMAVFAFVLDSLPDRVKVYPTENYFYFTFIHQGVPYAGN